MATCQARAGSRGRVRVRCVNVRPRLNFQSSRTRAWRRDEDSSHDRSSGREGDGLATASVDRSWGVTSAPRRRGHSRGEAAAPAKARRLRGGGLRGARWSTEQETVTPVPQATLEVQKPFAPAAEPVSPLFPSSGPDPLISSISSARPRPPSFSRPSPFFPNPHHHRPSSRARRPSALLSGRRPKRFSAPSLPPSASPGGPRRSSVARPSRASRSLQPPRRLLPPSPWLPS